MNFVIVGHQKRSVNFFLLEAFLEGPAASVLSTILKLVIGPSNVICGLLGRSPELQAGRTAQQINSHIYILDIRSLPSRLLIEKTLYHAR